MSARRFWTGMLLGVIGGLLLAPADGKTVRAAVKKAAKAMKSDLDNPYGKTRGFWDKARFRVENRLDDYRQTRHDKRVAQAKSQETGLNHFSDGAFAD